MMKSNASAECDVMDLDEERDDAVIGRALRWSGAAIVILGVVGGTAVYVLSRPAPAPVVHTTQLAQVQVREVARVQLPAVRFTDITQSAGIRFRHENGARGEKLLPETMGGGCAFLDYDNDGDQDILLVNSQRWPWDATAGSEPPATAALFQNDGAGHFTDVTVDAGLNVSLFGMGVAVGDYDGDGLVDVFLSAVGENRLFHNVGQGKFRDVTAQAGVAGDPEAWSTCCGWFDYDNDGDLDLFVGNYVRWSRDFDAGQNFQLTGGGRAYGRPQNFEGTFPYLYRNDGDGRFTEVAAQAGLRMLNPATGVPMAKTLGVTFIDCDLDGRLDILVANDTVQNFLFHNQGDGTFQDVGAETGLAFDMDGNVRGAMGIDVAPFRNNDAIGVAIGNFANEMTALYVSYGNTMRFMDEAIACGLGPLTRLQLTFGVFYFDCDLDGRLDLFAANGHLEEDINRVQSSQHYEQPPQLFWNCGLEQESEFVMLGEQQCGTELFRPLVGRGASYADIDADGDLDVLISTVGQSPRLLRNELDSPRNWVRFKLTGTRSNRDAIGAWIELDADGQVQRRQVMPTRSYLSQVELPVTFGLGPASRVRRVTVVWPDGSRQDVPDVEVRRVYEIRQSADDAIPRDRTLAARDSATRH